MSPVPAWVYWLLVILTLGLSAALIRQKAKRYQDTLR